MALWMRRLIIMKILFEMYFPPNELSKATRMIKDKKILYSLSLAPMSSSFSENFYVSVNAKYKLTAIEQPFMITWTKITRAIPQNPPGANLKKAL